MQKRSVKNKDNLVAASFVSVLVFVYIILFEFILPANKFLPKPSIIIETFPALIQEYEFLYSLIYSFSAVYSGMIISYLLMKIGYRVLVILLESFPGLKAVIKIGKYILPVFLIFLFKIWFGDSIFGEYLFIIVLLMSNLKSGFIEHYMDLPAEYIDSARSMGLKKNQLLQNIIFKLIQPKMFEIFRTYHFPLWIWVILYEYICMSDGLGSIYYQALRYKDLSLIVLLTLIIIIVLFIMEYVMHRIKLKYFFWD